MSMAALYDPAPRDGTGRALLIMLPGAKARAQDFIECGFVRAVRERGLTLDIAAVDAHLGHYLERSFSERLTHDIIAPARARNYRRIWLMGISLGGMGALTYAREHPGEIEGVVLLAPFLATRGTVAEVVRAGGWAGWQPGALAADDHERHLLAWLKAYRPAAGLPELHLGYGTGDRFVAARVLLGARLPAAQVVSIDGGHDWMTWLSLWRRLLERGLFAGSDGTARGPAREQLAVT
jgi:pimeloyl-ACP methyl ester carboxylesterase